jgi:hypothetical protein
MRRRVSREGPISDIGCGRVDRAKASLETCSLLGLLNYTQSMK